MKRYLLIHQAFVAPDEPGGTRHFEFARHCALDGDEFVIIGSSVSYLTNKTGDRSRSGESVDGVRVLRAYALPALHKGFAWRLASFLVFTATAFFKGLFAGRADVVMGTTPPMFQALSAWQISALRRAPFLLEIRDLWPEFAVDMGVLKNPLLIRSARALERFLYGRADHLLVNSPAYRTYLLSRGIAEEKISLIPNGVDPAMFDPQARGDDFRERWNLGRRFVATYAGALGPANDIPTILRAARSLRANHDIVFLLVGDGKDRRRLEELAREWELENVRFTGARPKAEMGQILAASDICVATLMDIPSFRTTYPNKVFDYLAAGRAVVLGIDGVIREVVEAARAGICVAPGDPDALASAVATLHADRQRAAEMGRSGRAYVVEHFDRNKHAQEFRRLLADLDARRD